SSRTHPLSPARFGQQYRADRQPTTHPMLAPRRLTYGQPVEVIVAAKHSGTQCRCGLYAVGSVTGDHVPRRRPRRACRIAAGAASRPAGQLRHSNPGPWVAEFSNGDPPLTLIVDELRNAGIHLERSQRSLWKYSGWDWLYSRSDRSNSPISSATR